MQERETRHRVIVSKDYYEPHGVPPERAVEAAFAFIIRNKLTRQTQGGCAPAAALAAASAPPPPAAVAAAAAAARAAFGSAAPPPQGCMPRPAEHKRTHAASPCPSLRHCPRPPLPLPPPPPHAGLMAAADFPVNYFALSELEQTYPEFVQEYESAWCSTAAPACSQLSRGEP